MKKPYYFRDENDIKRKPGRQKDETPHTYDFTFIGDDYNKHLSYLKGYMLNIFKYTDVELCHQAILRACRFSHLYNYEKSNKTTWMCNILKNIVIESIIAQKHKISIDKMIEEYGDKINFLENIENDDECEHNDVYKVVDIIRSSPNFILLKHRVIYKMSYEEMSNKLNINLGTLKNRIFKERKQLRYLLEEMNKGIKILY